jgi:hypothetical protein
VTDKDHAKAAPMIDTFWWCTRMRMTYGPIAYRMFWATRSSRHA